MIAPQGRLQITRLSLGGKRARDKPASFPMRDNSRDAPPESDADCGDCARWAHSTSASAHRNPVSQFSRDTRRVSARTLFRVRARVRRSRASFASATGKAQLMNRGGLRSSRARSLLLSKLVDGFTRGAGVEWVSEVGLAHTPRGARQSGRVESLRN